MPIPMVPSPLMTLQANKTYNAAWFGQTGDTAEQRVQVAITHAAADGADAVFVPAALQPLNNSLLTYNSAVSIFYETISPISADRGNVSVTLQPGVDAFVQRFATTLTANRTVTLPTSHRDAQFTIIRTAGGAFTLDIGPGLISLTEDGGWARVVHNGTAWQLAENSALGGSGALDVGNDPFTSQVETTGDASHPPFIHLSNPGGSGKNLVVRKLKVWGTSGQTIKIRRTSSPLATGGSVTSDTPVRMQEATGGSPVGVLEGCTAHGGTIFTRAESQWQFPVLSENLGYIGDVLESTDFPLWISPGSALEIALDANSGTNVVRAHAIWDEEAV